MKTRHFGRVREKVLEEYLDANGKVVKDKFGMKWLDESSSRVLDDHIDER